MAKKEYIGENRLSQLLTLLKSKFDLKANDADVVHKTGNESIENAKTFEIIHVNVLRIEDLEVEPHVVSMGTVYLPDGKQAVFLNPTNKTYVSNFDLNNYTTIGYYKFVYTENSSQPLNIPDGLEEFLSPKGYVMLYVLDDIKSDNTHNAIYQYLYAVPTNSDEHNGEQKTYSRVKRYDLTEQDYVWSEWKQVGGDTGYRFELREDGRLWGEW